MTTTNILLPGEIASPTNELGRIISLLVDPAEIRQDGLYRKLMGYQRSHNRELIAGRVKGMIPTIEEIARIIPIVLLWEETLKAYLEIDCQHRFEAVRQKGVKTEFNQVLVFTQQDLEKMNKSPAELVHFFNRGVNFKPADVLTTYRERSLWPAACVEAGIELSVRGKNSLKELSMVRSFRWAHTCEIAGGLRTQYKERGSTLQDTELAAWLEDNAERVTEAAHGLAWWDAFASKKKCPSLYSLPAIMLVILIYRQNKTVPGLTEALGNLTDRLDLAEFTAHSGKKRTAEMANMILSNLNHRRVSRMFRLFGRTGRPGDRIISLREEAEEASTPTPQPTTGADPSQRG